MPQKDDYHRTVVGYHGTTLSAALKIVNRAEEFRKSEKDYDWLGRGIYFWEYAPKQALEWAELRQQQAHQKLEKTSLEIARTSEPLAVVASMIRLGYCLDLTEPSNIEFMGDIFTDFQSRLIASGAELPKKTRKYRKLDCAVFEYAYNVLEEQEPRERIDTARGIYIPKDGSQRIWPGSWISRQTHIQLCVRNPRSILGIWLHHPQQLEVNDVKQAL